MSTRRRNKGRFTDEELPTAVEETIRTAPIRVTVDLAPGLHKALKRWCNGAALDLDLTGVALAEAARALVAELTEPDAATRLTGLEERVRERLRSRNYSHSAPTDVQ